MKKGSPSDYEKICTIRRPLCLEVSKSKIIETNEIVALTEISLFKNLPKFITYFSQINICEYERFIKFYNYFYDDQTFYIVSEYCLGNLTQFIEHRTLSEIEISAILRKMLEIISFSSSNNIKFTSIRTDNIFLCQDYQIKVSNISKSDFFLTCDEYKSWNYPHHWHYYVAPETISATGRDIRRNIWSLGIIAFELFQGKLPFARLDKIYLLLYEIVEGPPPKPPENASPEFQSFLIKCLKKDYKERPTVEELLNDPFIASVSESEGDKLIRNLIMEFEAFSKDEEDEYEEEDEEEEEEFEEEEGKE